MTVNTDTLIFIDIEASSLAPDSWPIEVGLAWIADGTVETWSSLIRPDPDWDEDAWSAQSAEVHGIARSDLDAAPLASDVAHEVMDRLHGMIAVSDAPAFDHYWAERLAETIGMKLKMFADFDAAVGSVCAGNHAAIGKVFTHLEMTPSPHRAGPDAARLAAAILHGVSGAAGSEAR